MDWSSLFSGMGSSLVNGIFGGGGGGKDIANTNFQMQNYATNLNYHMWQKSQEANQDAFNRTMRLQDQTNRNQIQWRVRDATKAGLHPLAALGINPSSGPSAQNFSPGQVDAPQLQDTGPSSMGGMGQNLASSVFRALTKEQRQTIRENEEIARQNNVNSAILGEQNVAAGELKLKQLEVDLYKQVSDLAMRTGTQVGSPSASAGDVEYQPGRPTVGSKHSAAVEAGIHPEFIHSEDSRGRVRVRMSPNITQSLENDLGGNVQWQWDNRVLPSWGLNLPPKPDPKRFPLKENEMWIYKNQAWYRQKVADWFGLRKKWRKEGRIK